MCSCDSVIGPPCNAHCVWLVVGLGVDRIVDAGLCSVRGPPLVWGGVVFPLLFRPPLVPLVWGWGWGCVFVLAC